MRKLIGAFVALLLIAPVLSHAATTYPAYAAYSMGNGGLPCRSSSVYFLTYPEAQQCQLAYFSDPASAGTLYQCSPVDGAYTSTHWEIKNSVQNASCNFAVGTVLNSGAISYSTAVCGLNSTKSGSGRWMRSMDVVPSKMIASLRLIFK